MSKQLRKFEVYGKTGLIRTVSAYGETDAVLTYAAERAKSSGNIPDLTGLYAVHVTRSRGDVLADMLEARR